VAATFLIGMVVALLLSLAGCTAPG
jgi:predicted small lipoprotein YifL